jgi:hypothetical protein
VRNLTSFCAYISVINNRPSSNIEEVEPGEDKRRGKVPVKPKHPVDYSKLTKTNGEGANV